MAGKQLSRLTSQDRVLTANDLFDPDERPHGAVMALKETKSLVDHSTQAHIFSTKAELDAFVAEQAALSEGERTVKVGDNLYITDTGVPDYWWMGEAPWISELETGAVKVDVDDALKADSANPVQNNVVKAALDNTLKKDGSAIANAGVFNWALGKTMAEGVIAGGWGTRYSTDNLCNYTTFEYDRIDVARNRVHEFFELTGDGDDKIARKKDLKGLGGFDPNVSNIAIGVSACIPGGKAIAIGESAYACGSNDSADGGVAIGRKASAGAGSVSIGGPLCVDKPGAQSVAGSVVIGGAANGHCWSVAIGVTADADTNGTAVGYQAIAGGSAVAVGALARTPTSKSVSIGEYAGDSAKTCVTSVLIGPCTNNWETAGCETVLYPIVIGTSCSGINPLFDATIRVDTCGNLTVGGKLVGGGGLSTDMDPVVIGKGATSQGYAGAVVIGVNAVSAGKSNVVLGDDADACGGSVMALGQCAGASGDFSLAIGTGARSSGSGYNAAVGAYAEATSQYTVAVGNYATASGEEATAVGRQASATGILSVAVGSHAESGISSIAIGSGASADGSEKPNIAIGNGAVAMGRYAVTIGDDIGNALAKSAMISAFDPDNSTHAFLRIIAGWSCTDTYLEFGRFDTLSGEATSVKIPMDKFSLLFTANGGVDGVTQGIVGGNSMYGYNG